ncbi:toll/interleukin-1 receptor domain-containing protein [Priestia megaterium]|uniref:toll/interleukin-1 receptor domain-containing protein n=1 Tax=Priestia megaterium TaxID=1404 RepID=UPI0023642084|nr:toll/interleukin-1 receptor domain-containing protein [Priestia megaterium]MDD1515918.1 toll/interleukin-1 receptor domain-containing protein [Priestia megaterium]
MNSNIDTILISHSHNDEKYVQQLVNLIKVTNIERESKAKIICSSIPGHGIPGDVNIYDYLRNELQGNVWVIYVLSQNYYNSAACLNEMGATWVQNKKYSSFLVPNFKPSNIKGAIDPSKNAFFLDSKHSLNDFKNLLLKEFNTQVDDNLWESVRDTALETILKLSRIELENSKSVRVDYEEVINSEEGKVTVVLRVTNNNTFPVELTYFKVTLKDINKNIYVNEDELSHTKIYSKENKILFRTYELGDSPFSINRNDSGTVEDVRFRNLY